MQLDETRIAIRERRYVDILDLALRVIRARPGPLVLAFSAGVVPMMLLNRWLLGDLAEIDFQPTLPAAYLFYMLLLIVWEAPLATAPATLYLGKAMFAERPELGEIVREFRKSLLQLLVYQVLLRFWYIRWLYLNEVILLDRNPMRRKSPGGVSTLRRSRTLHRDEAGDLAGRTVAMILVGGLLVTAIWGSIFLLRGILLGQWGLFSLPWVFWVLSTGQLQWEFLRPMFTFYFPLAVWIVVGYSTAVRFLSYLDLRIRREGWEVELVMRAERARLARSWT